MQKAYTLVQITDPHLHDSSEGTLLGMNTENSLDLIIQRVQQEVPDIDLILATGDIAQDSSVGAYQKFLRMLKPLSAPMRWVPGNHDSRENMAEAGQGLDHAEAITELGDWVVIMLDSIVPKKVYGNLEQDQLDLLSAALEKYKDKHVLVAFHHHPIPMESKWIDKIGVHNGENLNSLVAKHSHVKAVVCGHVHQESDQIVNGIRYISTPSTCVQFLPKSEDFGIDSTGPGFRRLVLNSDGTIETEVYRIEGVDFQIDYTQKGY